MSSLKHYLILLRPQQWLKNLMLFFSPFLGGELLIRCISVQAILPFTSFCLVSSAGYVLNDLHDRERDRHHPVKCRRPLASGTISSQGAWWLLVLLLAGATVAAWNLPGTFILLLVVYGIISLCYSYLFKHWPLFDIFSVSAGFLLRLEAGGAVFQVPVSSWLFLTVFLLSVFLSTGKRLSEKRRLGDVAGDHRSSLALYPAGFLEGAMYMTGGAVLVTYTMYVLSRSSSSLLLYSVPLCCFGLLRYMLRILSGGSGDPTESLTRDIPLFIVGLVWVLLVGWGIYG